MKKSCLIIIEMFIIFSLMGCSNLKDTKVVPSEATGVQIEGEEKVEEKVDESKEIDTSHINAEDNEKTDEFQLVCSGDYTKLVLINVSDKTEVNTYELGQNESFDANNIYQYDHGYAVIIRNSESEGINFIRFDNGLNVEENINLSDEVDQEVLDYGFEAALSEDGNMLVCSLGFKLYYYNLSDKTKGYLIEQTQDDIAFGMLQFVGNDKIAYIGSSAAEKEGDACVGIYNIINGSIEKYPISNYTAAGLSVNGNYACVTDYEDGHTGKSSGTVVALNIEKKEIKKVDVDENGSAMACISKDGKYVYAVNEFVDSDEYYVMQYKVEDNTLVNKYPLKFDENIKICSLKCNSDDNQLLVEYYTGKKFEIQSISYDK